MRVLADTRLYPPSTYAGAELAMHGLLRHLASEGHDCGVIVREGVDATVDGITILSVQTETPIIDSIYGEADVVITHLEASLYAAQHAARAGKPLVHLVHNQHQLTWFGQVTGALIVFNSQTLASLCAHQHPSIPGTILHPVVYRDDVYSEDARLNLEALGAPVEEIVQSNLSDLKGGMLFWRLAQREVDRTFTGVLGGYGAQIQRGADNVTVLQHVPHDHIADLYASARVVLMPSEYETWGMVAVEAMANGLPIIAHHSDGLAEAIGRGGVEWAHRGAVEQWSAALALLDEPEAYALHSAKSVDRFTDLQIVQHHQLAEITKALEALA